MSIDPFSTADGSTPLRRRALLRAGAAAGVGFVALAGYSEDTGTSVPAEDAGRSTETPTAGRSGHAETPSTSNETDTPADTDAEGGAPADPDGETPEVADSWYVRPDGDPQRIPSNWVCDDDAAERQPQLFDEDALSWGDDPGGRWELRIDDVEFDHGASVHVRLRNVSEEERGTGHPDGYNLQVRTDDGWEDVRVWRDGRPKPHPDEQVVHDPGGGFDWRFDATEAAFDDREVEVCPGLETARYRFAFEYDDEGIAVGFDLGVP